METCEKYSPEYLRYLELLSKEYKTQAETFTEIINLQAIVNLPKGTEHFMSDLHGEYEAFYHILNNCSGVIREKVEMIFANSMTAEERDDLLTLEDVRCHFPVRQGMLGEVRHLTELTYSVAEQQIRFAKYRHTNFWRRVKASFIGGEA